MIIVSRKVLPVTSPDIDNGAVAITGRSIVAVGKRRDILKRYPGKKILDLGGCLLMPGLVNLHTHLDLSHLHGLMDEHEGFFDWITGLVALKRKLEVKGAKKAASAALNEAIGSGTTCIGDISSTDIAIPAVIRSGIRAVAFMELIGLDSRKAQSIFDCLLKRIQGLERLPDRVSVGVSPHSAYSVSGKLYNKLREHILDTELSICIHLSETVDELLCLRGRPSNMDGYMKNFGWDRLKKNRGRSPIQFIKDSGLHEGLIAVHGVHVTKGDMAVLKRAGASVCHCPRSNHFLKVGKAPVEEFLLRGINVGLGTDSLASNLDMDLWEEMRFAYLVNNLKARQVIEMATINGARALGLGHLTGSLEPGKEADIIGVRTGASRKKDPCQHLILNTRKEDIVMTMIQGKTLTFSLEKEPIYSSSAPSAPKG